MAKIATYSQANEPLSLDDKLIGTEINGTIQNATKNFTLGELLNLFSESFPSDTLQQVLDTDNTAIQDINLTGTINASVIKPVNIQDITSSSGALGQVISKGVSGISWVTPSFTLQQVLDSGNSATQNMSLNGTITTSTIKPANITDTTNSSGTNGQILTKSVGGIVWSTPSVDTLSQVLSAGNSASNDINLTGTIYVTTVKPTDIRDIGNSAGTTGQVLGKAAGGIQWTTLAVPTLQQVLNSNNSASENINLVGTITASTIKPTNITDIGSSNGTTGQVLTKSAGGIQWSTPAAGGVTRILAGTNISISPAGGTGDVTINSTGGVTASALTGVNDTNVTLTLGGSPNTSLLQPVTLTLGWTGTLADSRIASATSWNNKQDALSGTGIVTSTGGTISYISGTSSQFVKGDGTLDSTTYGTGTVTSIATAGLLTGGTITTSGTISTSLNSNKLVGRSSAGVGIMEEITIGSGLSLSGGTLTASGASPLTTKGDIYTYSTVNARLPVGLDTQVLLADSSTATGLKWGTNTAPTPLGYYGAWQDNFTQTAAVSNVGYAMIFRTTDLSNGVTVVSNGTNLTRITFANTGIYNLQFSSQFQNIGNSEADVTIWIRKDGTDVSGSAGFVTVPKRTSAGAGNEGHCVVGWNYLLSIVAGEYYEIIWSTTSAANVTMQYYAAGSPPPSTASVIVTVTQQSGIMAGTGITAINSLTGAAQTLSAGTSGVDFAISSSGTTHTFNLPTASATNRGALSSTDWSTFDGKQNAISLTTIGSSGSATFVSNTLNVPTYTLSGLGGQPQLNGTGFVKASGTTISYDNSTYLTAAITSLGGLTGATQTFATGTSGTNFAISSAGTTHTFNLPTASATNTGKLSSTDWSTFNGKIGGSGTTNQITYFTASGTIGSLTTATYPSLTELSYVKGVTSSIQTQINSIVSALITTNRQVASYTLALTDANLLVEMNVGTANNLTVPPSGTVNFPTGTQIQIAQYGAGQTTVVAGVGVTIRSAGTRLKLNQQYSGATLIKIAADEWYLFGDLAL